jgi:hypothetical protein
MLDVQRGGFWDYHTFYHIEWQLSPVGEHCRITFHITRYQRQCGPSSTESLFMTSALIRTAEALAALVGFDLFIERDDPRCGLFDIEHKRLGRLAHEVWGLGLHITVSPDSRSARMARAALRG